MNTRLKNAGTTAMVFCPFYVFASGNEVLLPLVAQVLSIFIFLFWLLFSRIKWQKKLALAFCYFISLFLVVLLTWNVDYRKYQTQIDLAWTLGPCIATCIAYLVLRNRFTK